MNYCPIRTVVHDADSFAQIARRARRASGTCELAKLRTGRRGVTITDGGDGGCPVLRQRKWRKFEWLTFDPKSSRFGGCAGAEASISCEILGVGQGGLSWPQWLQRLCAGGKWRTANNASK